MHRLPHHWRVPHSRCNGLSRRKLERQGYDVLSWSREVGVDMFVKHDRSLQLFLQGHPEYNVGTLISEYRRDVARAQSAGMPVAPSPPVGLRSTSDRAGLQGLFRNLKSGHAGGMANPRLEMGLTHPPAPDNWQPGARRLLGNWLACLDAARYSKTERPSWSFGRL